MKLIILRSNLKDGLSALERAVMDNVNLPILKNIVLKADTRVTLQATNLEIGITYQTNAKINEPGSLTIPFAPLQSIIQNSTSERIVLDARTTLKYTVCPGNISIGSADCMVTS
jgi:DNA polymerase III sliding clamp (beta) subunit (PCNA family)